MKQTSKFEQITVTIDRVKNTSASFSVYTARGEGGRARTVKQFTGPVRSQQRWTLAGSEIFDPKWGTQFYAQFAALAAPTNLRELGEFLSSGLVGEWGVFDYAAILRTIGPDTLLDVCANSPHDLLQDSGITPEMITSLRDAWQRGSGLSTVFAQLAEWGCSSRQSEAIIKYYGAGVLDALRSNPYADLLSIPNYGWKTADNIGKQVGITHTDSRRITAGLETAVHRQTWIEGHTWLTSGQATMGAYDVLGNVGHQIIAGQIDTAVANQHLVRPDDQIWPEPLYRAEQTIASQIAQRLARPVQLAPLGSALGDPGQCSPEQWHAVQMALTEPLALLTGGPGTGKTTTLKTLIAAARENGMAVTLMAPTGKAAARMTEATGYPATTIHSRLKIVPGQALTADFEPVTGLVVVDEISMLDTSLAAALLSRISPAAQILLVGDPDQLPSVGPGAVLRDLLIAGRIPRVHLDTVYRNDAGIAVNAARIREGQSILALPDCNILPADSPEHAASLVVALLDGLRQQCIKPSDCLVLTPTNDGPTGRYALNALLQPILNPDCLGTGIKQYAGSTTDPDGTIEKHQEEICLHDRVMVIRNDPELGVFNGQTGTVVDCTVPRSLDVEIDGQTVHFAGENKRLLTLAYAITGHKAQGSEAPIVIAPIFRSRVLSREWLYTVITRARERCYLIGDVQAMQACIGVRRSMDRRTGLVEAIARTVEL